MITCPDCGADSGVIETRHAGRTLRRRRQCDKCRKRWTTLEVLETDARLMRNSAAIIAEFGVLAELVERMRQRLK